jgi:hypothetical protein
VTQIEDYAIELVHEGAAHCAQDDLDESGTFDNKQDWRDACKLAAEMAQVIARNPEAFLRWYLNEATL